LRNVEKGDYGWLKRIYGPWKGCGTSLDFQAATSISYMQMARGTHSSTAQTADWLLQIQVSSDIIRQAAEETDLLSG